MKLRGVIPFLPYESSFLKSKGKPPPQNAPADWFDTADIAPERQGNSQVFYSELTRGAQRDFEITGIPMSLASVPSVESEKEIFDLINFGGVSQGESDND